MTKKQPCCLTLRGIYNSQPEAGAGGGTEPFFERRYRRDGSDNLSPVKQVLPHGLLVSAAISRYCTGFLNWQQPRKYNDFARLDYGLGEQHYTCSAIAIHDLFKLISST